MWFKQVQVYQLITPVAYDIPKLVDQLEPLLFTPCLPSFSASHGWVSPLVDDEAPLVQAINGCMMLCLQFEEKILPATVVRQEVAEKVKELEAQRGRKIAQKEKHSIKDEVIHTLLPRAFSKLSRVHAYIDTKNNWLVIDSLNAAKVDKFIDFLKRSVPELNLKPIAAKIAPILTRWLTHKDYPTTLAIEKACVLVDPRQQSRLVRCQQQDLSTNAVQEILREDYEVNQIALSWHDRVYFTLAENIFLRSVKLADDVLAQAKEMDPETKQQQFDADFFVMTETFSQLFQELFGLLVKTEAAMELKADHASSETTAAIAVEM